MPDDLSHDESDDPGFAEQRNFYKSRRRARIIL
jgi:hypothetical protein